jgi:hypothetical protein
LFDVLSPYSGVARTFHKMLIQKYTGDITIHPEVKYLREMSVVLRNPPEERIQESMLFGEKITFRRT